MEILRVTEARGPAASAVELPTQIARGDSQRSHVVGREPPPRVVRSPARVLLLRLANLHLTGVESTEWGCVEQTLEQSDKAGTERGPELTPVIMVDVIDV